MPRLQDAILHSGGRSPRGIVQHDYIHISTFFYMYIYIYICTYILYIYIYNRRRVPGLQDTLLHPGGRSPPVLFNTIIYITCICIYIYTHAHIDIYIYMCTCPVCKTPFFITPAQPPPRNCMYISYHICIYMFIYMCKYIYMYIYVYIYI